MSMSSSVLTLLLYAHLRLIQSTCPINHEFNQCVQLTQSSLRFVVLGDWGGRSPTKGYATPQQLQVADQLDKEAWQRGLDFLVTTGDNFYEKGITKKHGWQQFDQTFEHAYSGKALRTVPWYITAGNHDHKSRGSIDRQLKYTSQSDRWCYPAQTYRVCYTVTDPQSGRMKTVQFIMIDTVELCGTRSNKDRPKSKDRARYVKFFVDTWARKGNELNQTTFVVGHYPPFSSGEHGSRHSCVEKRLYPIMKRHGAAAFFGGHDHNLQHIETDRGNNLPVFHTIVSGLGGRTRFDCHLQNLHGDSRLRMCWNNDTLPRRLNPDKNFYNGVGGYVKNAEQFTRQNTAFTIQHTAVPVTMTHRPTATIQWDHATTIPDPLDTREFTTATRPLNTLRRPAPPPATGNTTPKRGRPCVITDWDRRTRRLSQMGIIENDVSVLPKKSRSDPQLNSTDSNFTSPTQSMDSDHEQRHKSHSLDSIDAMIEEESIGGGLIKRGRKKRKKSNETTRAVSFQKITQALTYEPDAEQDNWRDRSRDSNRTYFTVDSISDSELRLLGIWGAAMKTPSMELQTTKPMSLTDQKRHVPGKMDADYMKQSFSPSSEELDPNSPSSRTAFEIDSYTSSGSLDTITLSRTSSTQTPSLHSQFSVETLWLRGGKQEVVYVDARPKMAVPSTMRLLGCGMFNPTLIKVPSTRILQNMVNDQRKQKVKRLNSAGPMRLTKVKLNGPHEARSDTSIASVASVQNVSILDLARDTRSRIVVEQAGGSDTDLHKTQNLDIGSNVQHIERIVLDIAPIQQILTVANGSAADLNNNMEAISDLEARESVSEVMNIEASPRVENIEAGPSVENVEPISEVKNVEAVSDVKNTEAVSEVPMKESISEVQDVVSVASNEPIRVDSMSMMHDNVKAVSEVPIKESISEVQNVVSVASNEPIRVDSRPAGMDARLLMSAFDYNVDVDVEHHSCCSQESTNIDVALTGPHQHAINIMIENESSVASCCASTASFEKHEARHRPRLTLDDIEVLDEVVEQHSRRWGHPVAPLGVSTSSQCSFIVDSADDDQSAYTDIVIETEEQITIRRRPKTAARSKTIAARASKTSQVEPPLACSVESVCVPRTEEKPTEVEPSRAVLFQEQDLDTKQPMMSMTTELNVDHDAYRRSTKISAVDDPESRNRHAAPKSMDVVPPASYNITEVVPQREISRTTLIEEDYETFRRSTKISAVDDPESRNRHGAPKSMEVVPPASYNITEVVPQKEISRTTLIEEDYETFRRSTKISAVDDPESRNRHGAPKSMEVVPPASYNITEVVPQKEISRTTLIEEDYETFRRSTKISAVDDPESRNRHGAPKSMDVVPPATYNITEVVLQQEISRTTLIDEDYETFRRSANISAVDDPPMRQRVPIIEEFEECRHKITITAVDIPEVRVRPSVTQVEAQSPQVVIAVDEFTAKGSLSALSTEAVAHQLPEEEVEAVDVSKVLLQPEPSERELEGCVLYSDGKRRHRRFLATFPYRTIPMRSRSQTIQRVKNIENAAENEIVGSVIYGRDVRQILARQADIRPRQITVERHRKRRQTVDSQEVEGAAVEQQSVRVEPRSVERLDFQSQKATEEVKIESAPPVRRIISSEAIDYQSIERQVLIDDGLPIDEPQSIATHDAYDKLKEVNTTVDVVPTLHTGEHSVSEEKLVEQVPLNTDKDRRRVEGDELQAESQHVVDTSVSTGDVQRFNEVYPEVKSIKEFKTKQVAPIQVRVESVFSESTEIRESEVVHTAIETNIGTSMQSCAETLGVEEPATGRILTTMQGDIEKSTDHVVQPRESEYMQEARPRLALERTVESASIHRTLEFNQTQIDKFQNLSLEQQEPMHVRSVEAGAITNPENQVISAEQSLKLLKMIATVEDTEFSTYVDTTAAVVTLNEATALLTGREDNQAIVVPVQPVLPLSHSTVQEHQLERQILTGVSLPFTDANKATIESLKTVEASPVRQILPEVEKVQYKDCDEAALQQVGTFVHSNQVARVDTQDAPDDRVITVKELPSFETLHIQKEPANDLEIMRITDVAADMKNTAKQAILDGPDTIPLRDLAPETLGNISKQELTDLSINVAAIIDQINAEQVRPDQRFEDKETMKAFAVVAEHLSQTKASLDAAVLNTKQLQSPDAAVINDEQNLPSKITKVHDVQPISPHAVAVKRQPREDDMKTLAAQSLNSLDQHFTQMKAYIADDRHLTAREMVPEPALLQKDVDVDVEVYTAREMPDATARLCEQQTVRRASQLIQPARRVQSGDPRSTHRLPMDHQLHHEQHLLNPSLYFNEYITERLLGAEQTHGVRQILPLAEIASRQSMDESCQRVRQWLLSDCDAQDVKEFPLHIAEMQNVTQAQAQEVETMCKQSTGDGLAIVESQLEANTAEYAHQAMFPNWQPQRATVLKSGDQLIARKDKADVAQIRRGDDAFQARHAGYARQQQVYDPRTYQVRQMRVQRATHKRQSYQSTLETETTLEAHRSSYETSCETDHTLRSVSTIPTDTYPMLKMGPVARNRETRHFSAYESQSQINYHHQRRSRRHRQQGFDTLTSQHAIERQPTTYHIGHARQLSAGRLGRHADHPLQSNLPHLAKHPEAERTQKTRKYDDMVQDIRNTQLLEDALDCVSHLAAFKDTAQKKAAIHPHAHTPARREKTAAHRRPEVVQKRDYTRKKQRVVNVEYDSPETSYKATFVKGQRDKATFITEKATMYDETEDHRMLERNTNVTPNSDI